MGMLNLVFKGKDNATTLQHQNNEATQQLESSNVSISSNSHHTLESLHASFIPNPQNNISNFKKYVDLDPNSLLQSTDCHISTKNKLLLSKFESNEKHGVAWFNKANEYVENP